MKSFFSIFIISCSLIASGFVYAGDTPIFEESDEEACVSAYASFQGMHEEHEDSCPNEHLYPSQLYLHTAKDKPEFEQTEEDHQKFQLNTSVWRRFKANFGMEKIFVRFPSKPAASQSGTLFTAYAYDYAVMYSICGYYPPAGNINPSFWFDEVLYSMNTYPCALISSCIFQATNGDWILDYVAHDYMKDLLIKARAIVTPFNAYTIQCVKPNGSHDYFDYFLDNFWIKCECHD